MPKLHELLAVDSQLKGQANKTRTELAATFKNKRHLFEEKRVTFQPSEEGAQAQTEEQSDIQTTVRQELKWFTDLWASAIDTSLRVAEGNTQAFADIVLDDDTVLMPHVPATALLELEKRVAEFQELLAAVPTLDPAKGFSPDGQKGEGIYVARTRETTRTKKLQKGIILAQATKEHPAQTALITEDSPVGRLTTQEWSGLITPAQKADMLERVEALGRAVKKARSRANEVELKERHEIGKKLFGYVLNGQ